jgi:predicted peptidase
VFLHGMGERGADNVSQLVNGVSEFFASDAAMDRFPAVVIAPQCPDGEDSNEASWSNWKTGTPAITKPTRLVLEIAEAVRKELTIDSDRMYIGGLSMGGFGTWNVIQEYPDLFAAAFPICGGGDPKKAERIAKLPLWVFHGAKDETVPPQLSRDMVQAIQAAGGHPGYSEYPDVGHDSWTNAFEEPRLLPWLFVQRRGHGGETTDAGG